MNTHEIFQLKELLSDGTKVVILTHKNPDGDALGSSLGMKNYLDKIGIEANVIVPNSFPKYFDWMPGCNKVINYELQNKIAMDKLYAAEVIFYLDFNNLSRMDEGLKTVAENSAAYKILIDHHLQPDDIADFVHHRVEASSTCELVYEFISLMGDESKIDQIIGSCLYTGIMTDTGSFRFSSTSSKTHQIASKLIGLGVNHTKIQDEVMNTYSVDRMRFLGYCISDKLVVIPKFHTAYIAVTAEELKRFNNKPGDSEGIVNYALSLSGIKFAAFFSEHEKEIRISFRSSGGFDVNQFARKYFNGGGHAMAAGGKSELSIVDSIKKFEDLLLLYQVELEKE